MLSGVRRITNNAGSTSKAIVSMPKTTQVWRQPIVSSSQAATTGMQTFAKPTPMLVNASARPRRRTNHWEITTLTTIEPISASPKVTTDNRKAANCPKLSTCPRIR